MKKIAVFILFVGIVLVGGSAMVAFDSYMNDDRKSAIAEGINAQLDENSARYEESREQGCGRRRSGNCGILDSFSNLIVELRDGIFLSSPFDPDTVIVETGTNWTLLPYDLETVENIVGHNIERTPIHTPTSNQLLVYFDQVANLRISGSVKIYTQDEGTIVMAIKVLKDGIRAGNDNIAPKAALVPSPFVTIDGIPVQDHPQTSDNGIHPGTTPVDYRHFSMDFDGQVEVTILALADDAVVAEFLSGFDISYIVEGLPQVPANYSPGLGMVQNLEPNEAVD